MSRKNSEEKLKDIKAVFYCDGSCAPNKGFAGSGVFGYTYIEVDSPKNHKYPVHSLFFTDKGVAKTNSDVNINVLEIIEIIKALNKPDSTNNDAELNAFISTLEKALTIPNLTRVDIYTDSKYLVNCFNESLPKWRVNGWVRLDNKKLVHLNEWKIIDEYVTKLRESNVEVTVSWVKGHADSYCNYIADLYSVIGSNASKINNNKDSNPTVILDKNSSYKEFKDSFFNKDFVCYFKDLYFSSDEQNDTHYCFLNSSEDPSDVGKKTITNIYSVNIGYVPDFINKFKEIYRRIKRSYVITCCIKLGKLDNKDLLRLTSLIPLEYMLVLNNNSYYLIGDSTPFMYECRYNYPFIMSAVSVFNNMLDINNRVNDYKSIDVTDYFVRDNKLCISNKDNVFDFSKLVSESNVKQKLLVTIGYDLPSYLALKSIEASIEKIWLIVVQDSNYLTAYFRIKTNNREIYTCNMNKKYIVQLAKSIPSNKSIK